MKKFFSLAAASVMLLSLAACSSDKMTPAELPAESPVQTAAPAESASSSAGQSRASEYEKAHAQGQLTACKSNLKNIATALEMWQSDHDEQCPENLSDITSGPYGGYLKTIPTCPAAREDTYSASYKRSADGKGFEVYCSGEHHRILGVPKDKPGYDSVRGLIEK